MYYCALRYFILYLKTQKTSTYLYLKTPKTSTYFYKTDITIIPFENPPIL